MRNDRIIRIADDESAGFSLFDPPESESFRNNALLIGVGDESYAKIADRIELMRCQPREIIFQENDPGDALFLIAQGAIQISKQGRGGRQETLAHLSDGDFFGEMAMVDGEARSARATSSGATILGRVDRSTWNLLLQLAPQTVLSNFMHSITNRLRHNNQHFIEQMMRAERLSLLGTTVTSIAHDMNNPIASILGASEAIQIQNRDATTARMSGIIRDAVSHLRAMTRELLDFSRGDMKLDLQPLAIDELLQDLQPYFRRCGPQIEVKVEMLHHGVIQADRHRLLRAFGNLIGNACESMRNSAEKRLRFRVTRVDSVIRFTIEDSGCGISPGLLPRVFEAFVSHGKNDGTGLGLAIGKAVIEAHRGAIDVTSSESGTIFRVDLPA